MLFVFFGLGAGLVGLALALALGTSAKRAAILSLCGLLAIAALVVAVVVSADTDSSTCRECNDYFGHFLSPLVFASAAMNVVGWYGGVAFGARLRGSRIVTNDKFYGLVSGSFGAVAFVAFLLFID